MVNYLEHSSKAIKGFPMGDPHQRQLPVLLPPSYNYDKQKRYPVIFLLAGWGSKSSKYLNDDSVFGISIKHSLQEKMASLEMPEAILAFPDGSSKLGCSQYINSASLGNYMDYICDELVELIDQTYRTIPEAAHRAIMGHSSGGFGALMIGMQRPDRFQYICSSAGDSFFEASLLPGLIPAISEIELAGGIEKFLDLFLKHPNPGSLGSNKFMTMLSISLAACYAPRPKEKPLYGELFFDLNTGKINDQVWQEYLAWDPVRKIQKYKENVQQLKFVSLECGIQDEYAAQWGHRQIAESLKKWKVPYSLNEYAGRHGGHNWRFVERIANTLEQMAKASKT